MNGNAMIYFFVSTALFIVGFCLAMSCLYRFSPNDWRGMVRSSRFWGGLVLSLVGTVMLILPLHFPGGLL